MMRNWRNADEYSHTAYLSRAQWAWEFLRRNPGYRADWQWFWSTWQALEADYGAPPHRDFARWKHDRRAYRQETEAGPGCVIDDDKVLIECWMGAKWGFYKFPIDPARDATSLGDDLVWRDAPQRVRVLTDAEVKNVRTNEVVLAFNLARPLKEQVEQARLTLVALQQRFKREGGVVETVMAMTPHWTLALRALDAEEDGAAVTAITDALGLDAAALADVLGMAHRLRDGDYRSIPSLPHE